MSGVGAGLRVLSYDVAGLRGDRAAMDAMVGELAPDVVIVQGAPRRIRWRTRNADLADRFGLIYAGGGEPSLGNVVLVGLRVSVPEVRYLRYPLVPGQLFRGAIVVRCVVAGMPFTVAGSQLSGVPARRLAEATLLAEALSDVDESIVLGLDTNLNPGEEPDGPAFRLLATGRQRGPGGRGAGIIVSAGIAVTGGRVVDTPEARRASPHLPFLADLRLPTVNPTASDSADPGR